MDAPPLIVIFGAAVRPDGRASAALLRRIGFGLEAARSHPRAPVLCSGGAVRPGPTEASLMAEALAQAGVPDERLILDHESLSTLDNAAAAARQVDLGGHPHVIACSDAYHLPRVRMLLALHGVASAPWRPGTTPPLAHGLGMALREGLAIPHNLAVVLARGGAVRP